MRTRNRRRTVPPEAKIFAARLSRFSYENWLAALDDFRKLAHPGRAAVNRPVLDMFRQGSHVTRHSGAKRPLAGSLPVNSSKRCL